MFSNLKKVFSSHQYIRRTGSIVHLKNPMMTFGGDGDDDIVWMDLEMTGLDVKTDKILEVSCLVTDKNLNIKSVGPSFAIRHPIEVLNGMNEWCLKQHNESGLVQKCLESQIKPEDAECLILDFLQQNIPKGKCPLAGNSVYMDRLFLHMYFPAVNDYMHYRIIDVSSIKELCRRWNPEIYASAPKKKLAHRSLEDIKESIEELKYYRQQFVKTPTNQSTIADVGHM